MKKLIIILGMIAVMALDVHPKSPDRAPKGVRVEGQRKYALTVQEGDSSIIKEFNRGLNASRSNRGFVSDVINIYRSTFAGQITSASTGLIEMGIATIKNATKDKRPQWESAVRSESQFIRMLPMQMEILDFYKAPSTEGPLDPTDLFFTGFGCKQYIEYRISEDSVRQEEVFNLQCKIRTDSIGIARMLNHSKFEVYVDYLSFNPGLCDLPNDSLGLDSESRIGFSFEKRKDLKFNVCATISSSWINQAMQVFNDQKLGEFNIVAEIDPEYLTDGVFEYSYERDKNSGKRVSVTGDSFLVPRSYVGSTDMENNQDSWGTGQYKVEMRIAETCKIRDEYYKDDNNEWDKTKWQPEWKLIKSRKPSQSTFKQIIGIVGTGYADGAWVTTLADPMKTYIIQTETGWLNSANPSMQTAASGANEKASQAGKKTNGAAPAAGSPNAPAADKPMPQ